MSNVVAIPKLREGIAPQFETARYFLICSLDKEGVFTSRIESCAGCEGFGRVRLLQDNHVTTLICSGIRGFYRELLVSAGVEVIGSVELGIEEALLSFRRGELHPVQATDEITGLSVEIPHEDLVCWAKELFESHGYKVFVPEDELAFPIDLVAETRCPVCNRMIRVAVCCGAHTYRSDQEIREFHHVTRTSFNARVYVYPASESVRECCFEYGIQVFDPDSDALNRDHVVPGRIPLLNQPIPGHERAFAQGGE